MSVIQNAVPRAYLLGTQDLSTQATPASPQQVASHTPLVPLFTQRGTTEPTLVDGSGINNIYGISSFDPRKPYFTHQSILAQTVLGNGNQLFVQRMLPSDAQMAMLRLSIEVIANPTMPVYQRDANGQLILGTNGLPLPLLNTTTNLPITVAGVNFVWHLNLIPIVSPATSVAQMFKQGVNSPGLLTVTGSTNKSIVYPILDMLVESYGGYGNNIGMRLSAPNAMTSSPANVSLMQEIKQYLYRFQFVELVPNTIMPNITMTQSGALTLDLCLAANIVDPNFGTTVSIYDGLIPAFQNLNPSSGPKIDSPLNEMYIYATNLSTVQQQLFTAEAAALSGNTATWIPIDYTNAANTGLMNILTATDFNGNPYQAISVSPPAAGDTTATFMDNNLIAVQYATGGADGTLTVQNFDSLVNNAFTNFGNYIGSDGNFWPLLDDARYPFSVVYDSGFSIPTKKSLLVAMGARPDVGVILGTHYVGSWDSTMTTWSVNNTQLAVAQEQAVAYALKVAAQMYPESDTFGTSTVRCAIFGQSGKLISAPQYGFLPLTIEIANKLSAYMGSPGGAWVSSNAPDKPRSVNNHVSLFTNINNTWQSNNNYSTDWTDALNYVQSFDMNSLFFPAFRTVYPNDTSILTSIFAMFTIIDLEKISKNVWRSFTGNSSLTDVQLIQQSNQLITKTITGRYDSRYVIIPNTFISPDDSARGYSWSVKINMYGDNEKTAASFTIVAQRMSALPASGG